MTKKISAKIFILLASALLVAHAVIPHLYYKNEVFIITTACSSDENHKHNAPEHSEDNDKDQHNCLLKQVVRIRPDEIKTEIALTTTDTNSNFNDILFYILTAALDNHFKTRLELSPPIQYKSSLYSRLGVSSISSRGSPIV